MNRGVIRRVGTGAVLAMAAGMLFPSPSLTQSSLRDRRLSTGRSRFPVAGSWADSAASASTRRITC